MMRTISFTDARANLKALMDRVTEDRAPVMITRQRGEGVVMLAASEWAAIEETLHLLQSPTNAGRLLESVADLDARGSDAS
ncbi:MAG: type II toxin-antitoxin system prevent-host-death family antitoxin [Sphingomonas bacterium]